MLLHFQYFFSLLLNLLQNIWLLSWLEFKIYVGYEFGIVFSFPHKGFKSKLHLFGTNKSLNRRDHNVFISQLQAVFRAKGIAFARDF